MNLGNPNPPPKLLRNSLLAGEVILGPQHNSIGPPSFISILLSDQKNQKHAARAGRLVLSISESDWVIFSSPLKGEGIESKSRFLTFVRNDGCPWRHSIQTTTVISTVRRDLIFLLFLDEKKQKSPATEKLAKNKLLQLKSFNSAEAAKDFLTLP